MIAHGMLLSTLIVVSMETLTRGLVILLIPPAAFVVEDPRDLLPRLLQLLLLRPLQRLPTGAPAEERSGSLDDYTFSVSRAPLVCR